MESGFSRCLRHICTPGMTVAVYRGRGRGDNREHEGQTLVGHCTPIPRTLWPFGSRPPALRRLLLVAGLVMSLVPSGVAARADRQSSVRRHVGGPDVALWTGPSATGASRRRLDLVVDPSTSRVWRCVWCKRKSRSRGLLDERYAGPRSLAYRPVSGVGV
jgi:hypothetical protein